MSEENGSTQAPALRILTPSTTPEEVAAIVAVLAGLGGESEPAPKPVSQWSSVARRVSHQQHPGRDAWKASALPR